jgi:hypothetical protein
MNKLPRCKHPRYQITKKQIPNSKKKIKYDASIGELNPKRLNYCNLKFLSTDFFLRSQFPSGLSEMNYLDASIRGIKLQKNKFHPEISGPKK